MSVLGGGLWRCGAKTKGGGVCRRAVGGAAACSAHRPHSDAPATTWCPRCKRKLPIGEYHKDARNSRGRRSVCRRCVYQQKVERDARDNQSCRVELPPGRVVTETRGGRTETFERCACGGILLNGGHHECPAPAERYRVGAPRYSMEEHGR